MARKSKYGPDKLYLIVAKLRATAKQSSTDKKKYNFRDPTALRALRIHRHLRALENDILDNAPKNNITLALEDSGQIVLCIRNEEVHCHRVAYLSREEFRLIRKNRKVANVLRKCDAWQDVA